jgi:hypothetical protein
VVSVTKIGMHEQKGQVYKAILANGKRKWVSRRHVTDEMINNMNNKKTT